jgi:hypothetical protein
VSGEGGTQPDGAAAVTGGGGGVRQRSRSPSSGQRSVSRSVSIKRRGLRVRHQGCGLKAAGGGSSQERVGISGGGFKYDDGDGPPATDLDER